MTLQRERPRNRTEEIGKGFRSAKPHREPRPRTLVQGQVEEILDREDFAWIEGEEQRQDGNTHVGVPIPKVVQGSLRIKVGAPGRRHAFHSRAKLGRRRAIAARSSRRNEVTLDYAEHLQRMTIRSLLVYALAMPLFLLSLTFLVSVVTTGGGFISLMLSAFTALTCGGLSVVAVVAVITAHLGSRDVRRATRQATAH